MRIDLILACALLAAILPLGARAEEKAAEPAAPSTTKNEVSEILNSLDYPELQVVPRASERLRKDALDEARNWWWYHWQIQLSGLSTLMLGVAAESNMRTDQPASDTEDGKKLATGMRYIGLATVAGATILGSTRPLYWGFRRMAEEKGKDLRTQLMRERTAEDALEQQAHVMEVMTWLSVASNLGITVATIPYLNTDARIAAGFVSLMAFLPMIFPDASIRSYEKHQEFKKKIYRPVVSSGFLLEEQGRGVYPTFNLTWNF